MEDDLNDDLGGVCEEAGEYFKGILAFATERRGRVINTLAS
jgi:hypothetical protein